MKIECKKCGEKFFVKKETVLSVCAADVGKCVALDMKKIDADGLRAFIKSKQMSIRGFARVLGVNSKTVDNWLRVGRFTGVARQSIEGGLARAYMADRWGNRTGRTNK